MASLAALQAQKGALGQEIILNLGTYYQSFSQPRTSFKADARQCRGAADAKVTIVEFFDFECPGCGAAHPILDLLSKSHPEIRLCVMPFPLSAHANALPAGQVALFARDHGKFWAMHDLLFANQGRLSVPLIVSLAGSLGLKTAEVQKAIDSGKYLDELKASREAGIQAGVDSTPFLYVNGRKFGLPLMQETLVHSAEDETEWQTHHHAWASD
jgi:protein-disulfide isomerase